MGLPSFADVAKGLDVLLKRERMKAGLMAAPSFSLAFELYCLWKLPVLLPIWLDSPVEVFSRTVYEASRRTVPSVMVLVRRVWCVMLTIARIP